MERGEREETDERRRSTWAGRIDVREGARGCSTFTAVGDDTAPRMEDWEATSGPEQRSAGSSAESDSGELRGKISGDARAVVPRPHSDQMWELRDYARLCGPGPGSDGPDDGARLRLTSGALGGEGYVSLGGRPGRSGSRPRRRRSQPLLRPGASLVQPRNVRWATTVAYALHRLRKLAGYSGLCPRVYQSGERDLRGPLVKQDRGTCAGLVEGGEIDLARWQRRGAQSDQNSRAPKGDADRLTHGSSS